MAIPTSSSSSSSTAVSFSLPPSPVTSLSKREEREFSADEMSRLKRYLDPTLPLLKEQEGRIRSHGLLIKDVFCKGSVVNQALVGEGEMTPSDVDFGIEIDTSVHWRKVRPELIELFESKEIKTFSAEGVDSFILLYLQVEGLSVQIQITYASLHSSLCSYKAFRARIDFSQEGEPKIVLTIADGYPLHQSYYLMFQKRYLFKEAETLHQGLRAHVCSLWTQGIFPDRDFLLLETSLCQGFFWQYNEKSAETLLRDLKKYLKDHYRDRSFQQISCLLNLDGVIVRAQHIFSLEQRMPHRMVIATLLRNLLKIHCEEDCLLDLASRLRLHLLAEVKSRPTSIYYGNGILDVYENPKGGCLVTLPVNQKDIRVDPFFKELFAPPPDRNKQKKEDDQLLQAIINVPIYIDRYAELRKRPLYFRINCLIQLLAFDKKLLTEKQREKFEEIIANYFELLQQAHNTILASNLWKALNGHSQYQMLADRFTSKIKQQHRREGVDCSSGLASDLHKSAIKQLHIDHITSLLEFINRYALIEEARISMEAQVKKLIQLFSKNRELTAIQKVKLEKIVLALIAKLQEEEKAELVFQLFERLSTRLFSKEAAYFTCGLSLLQWLFTKGIFAKALKIYDKIAQKIEQDALQRVFEALIKLEKTNTKEGIRAFLKLLERGICNFEPRILHLCKEIVMGSFFGECVTFVEELFNGKQHGESIVNKVLFIFLENVSKSNYRTVYLALEKRICGCGEARFVHLFVRLFPDATAGDVLRGLEHIKNKKWGGPHIFDMLRDLTLHPVASDPKVREEVHFFLKQCIGLEAGGNREELQAKYDLLFSKQIAIISSLKQLNAFLMRFLKEKLDDSTVSMLLNRLEQHRKEIISVGKETSTNEIENLNCIFTEGEKKVFPFLNKKNSSDFQKLFCDWTKIHLIILCAFLMRNKEKKKKIIEEIKKVLIFCESNKEVLGQLREIVVARLIKLFWDSRGIDFLELAIRYLQKMETTSFKIKQIYILSEGFKKFLENDEKAILNQRLATAFSQINQMQGSICARTKIEEVSGDDSMLRVGYIHFDQERWQDALFYFERCLASGLVLKDKTTVFSKMAFCCFRLRQFPKAVEYYEDLIAQSLSDEDKVSALHLLAGVYEAWGQTEKRRSTYDRISMISHDDDFRLLLGRGQLSFDTGRWDEAAVFLEQADRIECRNIAVIKCLINSHFKLKNWREMIFYCEKLILLRNSDWETHILMGTAYENLKKYWASFCGYLDAGVDVLLKFSSAEDHMEKINKVVLNIEAIAEVVKRQIPKDLPEVVERVQQGFKNISLNAKGHDQDKIFCCSISQMLGATPTGSTPNYFKAWTRLLETGLFPSSIEAFHLQMKDFLKIINQFKDIQDEKFVELVGLSFVKRLKHFLWIDSKEGGNKIFAGFKFFHGMLWKRKNIPASVILELTEFGCSFLLAPFVESLCRSGLIKKSGYLNEINHLFLLIYVEGLKHRHLEEMGTAGGRLLQIMKKIGCTIVNISNEIKHT